MNPRIQTALSIALPLLLGALRIFAPSSFPTYVSTALVVLLAVIAVLNVFHVNAAAVAVIQSLVDALQAASGNASEPSEQTKIALASAKKIRGVKVEIKAEKKVAA